MAAARFRFLLSPALLLTATLAVPSAQKVRISDLLDLYLKGDFDAAVAPLATVRNAVNMAIDLDVDGGDWTKKGATPADIERRRLVAASLALEFLVLRLDGPLDSRAPASLIEWGCSQLRKGLPHDRELAWQRAALAVMQGARTSILASHLPHAATRFPSEPAVPFTQGFFEEFYTPVEGRLPSVVIGDAEKAATRAMNFYRRAAVDSAFTHEAALRMGYLQMRMNHLDNVLPYLATAAASDEPFVRYHAHLIRGRTLERLGSRSGAEEAYRAALSVIPHTQSAALSLAAVLHQSDRAELAIEVLSESFASPPARDPWRDYGFGQFRHWTRLRDRMREATR